MKRRDLLRGIGAIIGVGVVGKAVEVEAAPLEVTPVEQPQSIAPHAGRGSITIYGEPGTYASGTASFFRVGPYWLTEDEKAEFVKIHELGYPGGIGVLSPHYIGTSLPREALDRARKWAREQGYSVGGDE